MRKDFDEARAKAPAVMFIDEIDSFPVRASVTHSHKDYVTEAVNGFLEQLDGLAGREGLIFIGAPNDVRRCESAILRSVRLNRVIEVRRPGPNDLEKMFCVRLRGELADADLTDISLLALGSSGADIERIVKDARRFARHAERSLTIDDLLVAVAGTGKMPPEELRRTAVHEAGHVLMEVVHHGPDGVHAVLQRRQDSAGSMMRFGKVDRAGTHDDYVKVLQTLLAGRAAEEVLLGAPGHGCGGSNDSDLAMATRITAVMTGSLGHAGPHPLVHLAPSHDPAKVLKDSYMRAAANEILPKAYDEAKDLLVKHSAALMAISKYLLTFRRITVPAPWHQPAVSARAPAEVRRRLAANANLHTFGDALTVLIAEAEKADLVLVGRGPTEFNPFVEDPRLVRIIIGIGGDGRRGYAILEAAISSRQHMRNFYSTNPLW